MVYAPRVTIRIELSRSHRKRYEQNPWWVDQEQIRRVLGPPDPTATALLVDDRGQELAWGLYSPQSPRPFRAVSLSTSQGLAPLPPDWIKQRLAKAFAAREPLLQAGQTTALRMVNSEGDGLPGLTLDRFGDHDVIALSCAAMLARQAQIQGYLEELSVASRTWIYPQAALEREGVDTIPPALKEGSAPEELAFFEDGLEYRAPAPPSQKTGAYLDQRDNRRAFAQLIAKLQSSNEGVMLDVGSHIGGFSLQAARAGLRCIAIDQSERVLEYVTRNAALNGLQDKVEVRSADMFSPIASWDVPETIDAVVFDPPKVARHPQERKKAMGAMSRTVAQLWPRLRPGGYFAICSCSHHLGFDHLDQIMRTATAQQLAQQVARWGPGVDHPVALCHNAGHYLRVAVYRK